MNKLVESDVFLTGQPRPHSKWRGPGPASQNFCSNERIEYKLLSLTCKALSTAQPTYLHSLISVHPLVLLAPHLLSPSLDHLHLLL